MVGMLREPQHERKTQKLSVREFFNSPKISDPLELRERAAPEIAIRVLRVQA
jgi:hypothetical protein